MWQSLKEKLEKAWLPWLIGMIMGLSGPFLSEAVPAAKSAILNQLTPTALLSLSAVLLLICVFLLALLYELRRKRTLIREYTPEPEWPGTHRHKNQPSLHVCGIC